MRRTLAERFCLCYDTLTGDAPDYCPRECFYARNAPLHCFRSAQGLRDALYRSKIDRWSPGFALSFYFKMKKEQSYVSPYIFVRL